MFGNRLIDILFVCTMVGFTIAMGFKISEEPIQQESVQQELIQKEQKEKNKNDNSAYEVWRFLNIGY